jgi:hypothetical protein
MMAVWILGSVMITTSAVLAIRKHERIAELFGLGGAAAWLAYGINSGRWWADLTGLVIGAAMLALLLSGWSRPSLS